MPLPGPETNEKTRQAKKNMKPSKVQLSGGANKIRETFDGVPALICEARKRPKGPKTMYIISVTMQTKI